MDRQKPVVTVKRKMHDPGNLELSAAQLRSMRRVAPVKRIRWQLGLSQEEFANRFEIPVGTVRDWEQGRSKPDRAAAAYIKAISADPTLVSRALGTGPFDAARRRGKA